MLINLAFEDSESFEDEDLYGNEAIDRFFDFYNKKYRGAKFFWGEKLYAELLRIVKKTITVDKKDGISASETYEKIIELVPMPEDLYDTVYLINKDEIEDTMSIFELLYNLLAYDDDSEPLIPEIALLTELD